MPSALEILTKLQAETNIGLSDLTDLRRLNFFEIDGLFHIEYYGLVHREPDWSMEEEEEEPGGKLPVFEILTNPEVASKVASLSFDGSPDQGFNGTRTWDFSWLLAQDVTFPELKSLLIAASPIDDDIFTVLDDGGQLASWLMKAPKLEQLTTPSAPNAGFFSVEHEPLTSMQVDAGWDPADFILNLSRHPKPLIWGLDWNEVHPWHVHDRESLATPYAHFQALLTSPACPPSLTLRNPELDDVQLKQLAKLHREARQRQGWNNCHFRVFRTSYRFYASANNDRTSERHTVGDWTSSSTT